MQQTTLQLVEVSHTTVLQWHNKRVKKDDNVLVTQGLELPSRLDAAADPFSPANVPTSSAAPQLGPSHQYHMPRHTVGQAKVNKGQAGLFRPGLVRPFGKCPTFSNGQHVPDVRPRC